MSFSVRVLESTTSQRKEKSTDILGWSEDPGVALPFSQALDKLEIAVMGACNRVYPLPLGLSPPAIRQVGFAKYDQQEAAATGHGHSYSM
jgi:hypothetical protein